MRDFDLTTSFERFRREGDPAALAYVFDRIAPELLRVARHLTRDAEGSEDLLQSTFVAAIEGREGFDASRRVEAWLIGILINQAGLAYRKAKRTTEVELLPEREEEASLDKNSLGADPLDGACAAELRDEVRRVIKTLPPVYREVLQPKLLRDARSVEIARTLGRTPSVVRAQVHRGLELLRRALPAGLASLLFLSLGARRSLAGVRQNVLARAVEELGLPPSVSTAISASAFIGGTVMLKKLGIGILVAVCTLGTAWYIGLFGSPEKADPSETHAVALPEREEARGATPSTRMVEPAVANSEGGRVEIESGPPDSFTRHLSGLRGRLVEANGSPVVNTRLIVRQLHPDTAFSPKGLEANARGGAAMDTGPILDLGESMTDSAGRFTVGGVRAQGMIALLVDPGGSRATLKWLEIDPPKGEVLDLGDVVLAASTSLSGTVSDQGGAPIAGARVRAGLLQTAVMMFGLQHYRSGDGFVMMLPEQTLCGDIPQWIDELVDDLLPVAVTDASGRFDLPRVAEGSLNVMVQAEGYVSSEKTVRVRHGQSNDAGELRMTPGASLLVDVVDAQGVAQPDVQVRVGFAASLPMGALMRSVGRSDANGRISIEDAPQDAAVFVAARRAVCHEWKVVGPIPPGEPLRIALPETFDRWLRFVDGGGEAVSDVSLEIAPVSAAYDPVSRERPWTEVIDSDSAEQEDGRFHLAGLAEGAYRWRAVSGSFGLLSGTLEIPDGPSEETFLFGPPRTIDVTVLDAIGGSPIHWASVTLHTNGLASAGETLFRSRSSASGEASLGPIGSSGAKGAAPYLLRVDHPGYGRAILPVDAGGDPVVVSLRPGGVVEGRVLRDGVPPTEPLTVTLRLGGEEPAVGLERDLAWMQRIDTQGYFAIDSLPEGRFTLTVDGAKFEADGLAMFAMQVASSIHESVVEVRSGVTSEVALEIGDGAPPTNAASTASIQGTVRVIGDGSARFSVTAVANRKRFRASTDVDGRYSIEGLPAGPVRLSLGTPKKIGTRTFSDLFFNQEVELHAGEVRSLDFSFTKIEARVVAIDGASGLPRPGAKITLRGSGSATSGMHDLQTTGADGIATLATYSVGEHSIHADAPGAGIGKAEVVLSASPRSEPIRVVLDAGVPCAGQIVLPDGVAIAGDETVEIMLSGDSFQRVVQTTGKELRFDVRGARPGPFSVLVFANRSGKDFTGTFELPATGKADLTVRVTAPK